MSGKPPPPRARAGHHTVLEAARPPADRAVATTPVARVALDRPRLTLGREAADVLLDSPIVSRLHAVVERTADGPLLRDLGSMNGMFVAGSRVARARLAPGVRVRIGPFSLESDGKSLWVHDERGALRIDAVQLGKRVGGNRWILRDVSLSVLPRELVALVGGSGAGKTTLMKALAGYAPASTGGVFLNGDDYYAHLDEYRSLLGYVPQEDIVHRELPVRRALAYTARLRLPPDTRRAERTKAIERALAEVEMTDHADKRIADLSGGQRKRVSIAAELLADPSLFFLDEPTSGLDPGLEKKMMHTLRRLADGGRTVVLVTHATANLDRCDHVAFVAGGRLVFFGPPAEVLPFFRVASGDVADVYGKLEGAADPSQPERLAVARADLAPELARLGADGARPALAELWEAHFRASRVHAIHVQARLGQAPVPEPRARRKRARRAARVSSARQLAILSIRYLDLLFQDRKNLAILLLQAPIIGWLVTIVASTDALVGKRSSPDSANTVLFMLSTVAVWFGVINSAREITKESAILRRERLAGLRLGPYLASKVVILGLLVVVQSAVLLAVVAQKVVLPVAGPWREGPLELFVTTWLTAAAGVSLGLCISASSRTPDRAISAVPLVLIPQILFSGVLFPLGKDGSTIRILSWFTISRWATDAYAITDHLTRFPVLKAGAPEYAFTQENLWTKWATLGGYSAACLFLAAILLHRRSRAEG